MSEPLESEPSPSEPIVPAAPEQPQVAPASAPSILDKPAAEPASSNPHPSQHVSAHPPAASPPSGTQPMQHGHMPASGDKIAATLIPAEGWHFLHLYYGVDRDRLAQLSKEERRKGRKQVARALTLDRPGAPEQMQCFAVPGHKGDLGFMAAGPDIHAIHGVQLAIQKSVLGRVLVPNYSFYSITEISEYVPSVDQYGEILKRDGLDSDSDMYKAKVAMYEKRLGPMNAQRLFPEFPDWPCMVFYPMSKTRLDGHNWYMLPFAERSEMMAQHGKSGMKFAGKVTQTITASTGLDDWEWGVTLWAKNPSYLKDIVYAMRFDEASAKYALFGEFRFGYILKPEELLETVGL